MYKAIISDFDGTLADITKNVCEYNLSAIKEMRDKGFQFALCTGRMTASALRVISPLPFKPLVGAFNGSEIVNARTGETLYSSALSAEDCLPLIDYAVSRGVNCQVYDDTSVYPMHSSVYTEMYGKSCGCPEVYTPDLKSLIIKHGKTPKFLIIDEPEKVEALIPEIKEKFGDKFEIAKCYSGMVDFTPKGSNKGAVVGALCKIWGIKEEECIAIGDEFNDVSMLRRAGLGIAVANASDGVKAEADYVTERTNVQGAVGEAIRKFILCE